MTPQEISEKLRAPFPEDAVKQRKGTGKQFDYLSHGDVTERLIEATGNCFDLIVIRDEIEDDDVHKVTVRLIIPGLGQRDGTGTAVIAPSSRPGFKDSYKVAESDAIKRAAMRFGVGLQLYRSDDDEEEYEPPVRRRDPEPVPTNRPPAQLAAGGQPANVPTHQQMSTLRTLLLRSGDSPVLVDWSLVTPAIAGQAILSLQNNRHAALPRILNRSVEQAADTILLPNAAVSTQQDTWTTVVRKVTDPSHIGKLVNLAKRAVNDDPKQAWRFWELIRASPAVKTVEVVVEVIQQTKIDRESEAFTKLMELSANRILELQNQADVANGPPAVK